MNNKKYFAKIVCVLLLIAVLVVTFTGCNNKTDTTYDTVKTTKMNNFTHLNKRAKHGEVVMIGDSIVEIYNTSEQFADVDKIVYNRGISGDTSDKLLERLHNNALNIKPSTIFLLVGTNDIGRGISQDVTLENAKKIIIECKQANIENIVIESVYPVNYNLNKGMVGSRKNEQIIEYNSKLKALCENQNVTYVDVYSKLTDENGEFNKNYTYDGLHPNETGYDVITAILKEYIK